MSKKEDEPSSIAQKYDEVMGVISIAVLGSILLEAGKAVIVQKLDEAKERRKYLQSKEGLRETIDSRSNLMEADAYARKKRFDALVAAGFTEDQAFKLMIGEE